MYRNPWLRVREDLVIRPDGTEGIYGVVEPFDNVAIVALTERLEVYLVGEYLYPLNTYTWKIPSGAVHPSESNLEAAKRELREETGITAQEWVELGSFYMSGGISTQVSYLYLARDLNYVGAAPEVTEVLEPRQIPLEVVYTMCNTGVLKDAPTLVGIMRAFFYTHPRI